MSIFSSLGQGLSSQHGGAPALPVPQDPFSALVGALFPGILEIRPSVGASMGEMFEHVGSAMPRVAAEAKARHDIAEEMAAARGMALPPSYAVSAISSQLMADPAGLTDELSADEASAPGSAPQPETPDQAKARQRRELVARVATGDVDAIEQFRTLRMSEFELELDIEIRLMQRPGVNLFSGLAKLARDGTGDGGSGGTGYPSSAAVD
jgi:hypothetical protein